MKNGNFIDLLEEFGEHLPIKVVVVADDGEQISGRIKCVNYVVSNSLEQGCMQFKDYLVIEADKG